MHTSRVWSDLIHLISSTTTPPKWIPWLFLLFVMGCCLIKNLLISSSSALYSGRRKVSVYNWVHSTVMRKWLCNTVMCCIISEDQWSHRRSNNTTLSQDITSAVFHRPALFRFMSHCVFFSTHWTFHDSSAPSPSFLGANFSLAFLWIKKVVWSGWCFCLGLF